MYILEGKKPVKTTDVNEWSKSLEDNRQVAIDRVGGECTISTVFLGDNRSTDKENPIFFETNVLGGERDGYSQQYSTWDEAERGHRYIKRTIREDYEDNIN
ncbi:MAG: hypothetical protein WCI04_00325 [archaeon]|jgi:hypothetical protein